MKSSFEKYGPFLRRALVAAVVLPPLVALTSPRKAKTQTKSSSSALKAAAPQSKTPRKESDAKKHSHF